MVTEPENGKTDISKIAITWPIVAMTLATILLSVVSFFFVNINNRLAVVETTVAGRGERIALLENKTALFGVQVEKFTATLEKINETLAEIKAEHKALADRRKQ